jgi:hypothetical protein
MIRSTNHSVPECLVSESIVAAACARRALIRQTTLVDVTVGADRSPSASRPGRDRWVAPQTYVPRPSQSKT